jgi:hypothetical protein
MRYTRDMTRNKFELCSGFILIIVPFLGFPSPWKTVVYVLIGISFVILASVGHFKRRSEESFYDPEAEAQAQAQKQREVSFVEQAKPEIYSEEV